MGAFVGAVMGALVGVLVGAWVLRGCVRDRRCDRSEYSDSVQTIRVMSD